MTESALLNSIAEELNTELSSQPMYSAEIVALKVKDAYRKVRARRCYENTSKKEEDIISDLYNRYFQDIKDVALFNFAQMGAPFQTSHNENSVVRAWRTEDNILGNIDAFIKVF